MLFSLNNLSISNLTSLLGKRALKLSLIVNATLKFKELSPKSVNNTFGGGSFKISLWLRTDCNNNFLTN